MIAVASLLYVLSVQGAPQALTPDDPALTAAVQRFFEMQEKEDVDGYLALWSTTAQRPQVLGLRYIFDNGDDKFSDIAITRITPSGNRVRVRVSARRDRTIPSSVAGVPPRVMTMPMQVALTFDKEGGEWKLIREGNAFDDLAGAMVDAGTPEERETLLAAEPELMGRQLLSAFARLGSAAAASGSYPRSVAIFEQLAGLARRGGHAQEEGQALQNIANAYYFQRKFAEALAAYQQRLVLERERQDEAAIAAALAGIATIKYSFAEYTDALNRYREALAIHEKLDDVAGIAFASLSIGNILYLQGDFPSAIAAYKRSLTLNRTMAAVDGETRALEGLGRVYTAQGDYAGALEAFDLVRRDRRVSDRVRLGVVTQSIGEVHFRLGNLDGARASYQESRAHFEAARDMPNVGRVMQGIALTELVAARFQLAEDLYTKSAAICAAEDRECSAHAVAGLAFAQAAQDNFIGAAASYRKAIDAFTALGRREDAARSHVGLAQALTGSGDYAGSIEAASAARQDAIAYSMDDVLWRALAAEARAVRRLGHKDRALGVARAAVVTVDRMLTAALDRPGGTVSGDASGAFATLAVLQAESGDAAGAFDTSERLRAFEIRGGLAVNERDIARGLTPEERDEERTLAAQLLTRLAQLTREKSLPKPDPARVAELEKAVTDATDARRTSMQRLYEAHPSLRDWRGLAAPRRAADALQLFSSSGNVLVSLVLDEDDLLLMTVARRASTSDAPAGEADPVVVEAHVIPVKRRHVAELVATLQKPEVQNALPVWRKAAAEITALIPPPVVERLSAATRVLLIPHDMLWRVPFEALPAGNGLLIGAADFSLGGSLGSLIRSAEAAAGRIGDANDNAAEPRRRSILAVGASELSAARVERLKQVAPAWALRQAEQAASEVAAAAAAYDAASATILTKAAATERELRVRLPDADVLHVASPFRINAVSPLFSPVLLSGLDAASSPPEKAQMPASAADSPRAAAPVDAADDGALELREVMNLESRARVAVFSDGAATSMRDGASATDVLQWGWLAAGVPSLLVSRWPTPSASSDRLLAAFHKELQRGLAPAAALRAAQTALRSNKDTVAPIHWAGWMLVSAR